LVLLLFLLCAAVANGLDYPVPTPAGGRNAVHGWLILPIAQPIPVDPATPLDAWFVHHTPEFAATSPHNFQIILRGSISPLPCAENITYAIDIPIPPTDPLVVNEFTVTPPPPFSLNDLLNGQIRTLLGVVYNGSFDTSYERYAISIANFAIQWPLTTAVWLNDSSAIQNYPQLRYYSYPRSLAGDQTNDSVVHLYLSHKIHSAPDFDQVIHATINFADCKCTQNCTDDWQSWIVQPGITFEMPGIPNNITSRLMPSSTPVLAQLTEPAQITCKLYILEQIHCVVGPWFGTTC